MEFPEQLLSGMRRMAGTSLDVAEANFDRAADSAFEAVRFADQAAAGLKQGATELQLKVLEVAELNAQAWLSYWRMLLTVDEAADLNEINRKFIAAQFAALFGQALDMGHLAMRLTAAVPPRFPGLKSSSFSE
jgi:hypothetical protein